MRPGQQKQRGRGRSGGGGNPNNNNSNNNNNQRKGQNPLTRTYDSSGPDVKIRGTAQHIAEKYMALARDATSSGDRVMAENYLQHAEHYNRIIAAAQAMFQERFQQNDRADGSERDDDDSEGAGVNGNMQSSDNDGDGEQPSYQPQPRSEQRQRNDRQNNDRQYNERQNNDRQQQADGQQPERQERQPQERQERQPQERQERQERPERTERPERAERPERQPRAPRQPMAEQPQPVIIDESTPQPVFDDTPAEVQIEQETVVADQAESAPRRRSNAGRPRRTPRTPRGETAAEGEAPQAAEPIDVPAE
jgi:hypothetical protein